MVRETRPSRSRTRSVWVSIFWLTPAMILLKSLYRCDPSASATRIKVTHLSLIRSSTWRDGHAARNASYSARAASRRWPAVSVGIGSHLPVANAPQSARLTSEMSVALFWFVTKRRHNPMLRRRANMRAVVVSAYGGPEALEVVNVPVPEPRRGQLRIRVEAAAVNPVDFATREGHMNVARPGVIRERRHVGIGWDVAGTVEAIGAGVTAFSPGDPVIGLRDRLDQDLGTYAEQVV